MTTPKKIYFLQPTEDINNKKKTFFLLSNMSNQNGDEMARCYNLLIKVIKTIELAGVFS